MTKRILIADDDYSIRKLLHVNLAAEGYEIVAVSNGMECLNYLESNDVQLIILDIMMPERDGWEVCKIIRDAEGTKRNRILMLTARDTARDRMIGTQLLGADAYMTKPFDIDDLVRKVGSLLEVS